MNLQKFVDAIRAGKFHELHQLTTEIMQLTKNTQWGQDELTQLISYGLAKTDLTEKDLDKIILVNEFAYSGQILTRNKRNLTWSSTSLMTWMVPALVAKRAKNHESLLTRSFEPNQYDAILAEDEEYASLLNDQIKEIKALSGYFAKYENNAEQIRDLSLDIESDEANAPFVRAIRVEVKLYDLSEICKNYLQHLRTVFQQKLIKCQPPVSVEFENNDSPIPALAHNTLSELDTLKEQDSSIELALRKYEVVMTMLEKLYQDKSSTEKLNDFKDLFMRQDTQNLLNKNRSSEVMIFLKGVATLLSFGLVCLIRGFWKPESQLASEAMSQCINHGTNLQDPS